ncbi:MAG: C39 family peptidase [Bacillota bacterium]|nr:C39 family peptidase [Bacillota bacterium]
MYSLYPQIIVLVLLLILLLWLLKKAARIFKSIFMFFVIFFILITGFLLDSSKTEHAALAFSSIKSWFHPSAASSFLGEHINFPNTSPTKDQVQLDAPVFAQLPQLPRGCEVTSLAMLLNYAGVKVDKMELAEKVKRDQTPRAVINGTVHFGNPNDGFVGNMYNLSESGYGVYHEPIAELAETYLPGRIKDLSSSEFDDLKIYLSDGKPIWVITNTLYQKLGDDQFTTWDTPTGQVKITFKEHAVLLTGYDQQNIYFNDPLTGEKNKKAPIADFKESWVQMGSQAITFVP